MCTVDTRLIRCKLWRSAGPAGIIAERKLQRLSCIFVRKRHRLRMAREGAHDQIGDAAVHALIHEDARVQWEIFPVSAVEQRLAPLAQGQTLPVELEDTVLMRLLLCNIDAAVIVIHTEPRFVCGESGVFARRPLHRCAGGVAAGIVNTLEPLRGRLMCEQALVIRAARQIHVLADVPEPDIRHADLLPLVDERRSL